MRRSPPSRAFQLYRDRIPTFDPAIEAPPPALRTDLRRARSARTSGAPTSNLAWDFTVASERNLAGRLAAHPRRRVRVPPRSGAAASRSPQVDENVDTTTLRRVTGTFTVPNYLTGTGQRRHPLQLRPGRHGPQPRCRPATGTTPPTSAASSRARRARTATTRCTPRAALRTATACSAAATRSTASGHSPTRATRSSAAPTRSACRAATCRTSRRSSATCRTSRRSPTALQQGILNMQFLGRLLKDPHGFASNPAFQAGAAHTPLLERAGVLRRQQPGRHPRRRDHRDVDRLHPGGARGARR